MLRTLTGFGFALALVGSAHAQDTQVTVQLDGKSRSAVRSELYRAAEKVCASDTTALNPVDATCVEATYQQAVEQLRPPARIEHTAYVQASSTGIH